jgi:hypothetical protein
MKKTPEEMMAQLRKNIKNHILKAQTEEELLQRREMYLESYTDKYGALASTVWDEMVAEEKAMRPYK